MDPQVKALIDVVQVLVIKVGALTDKVDGLICHYTSIDADYGRVRNTLLHHESRLARLEKEHNFEPHDPPGTSSALYPAIK